MEEKQINKYLRKQFAPIGWTLVVYHAMMLVTVMMAMIIILLFKIITTGDTTLAPEDGA